MIVTTQQQYEAEQRVRTSARNLRETTVQIKGVLKAFSLTPSFDIERLNTLDRQHAGLMKRFAKLIQEDEALEHRQYWIDQLEDIHSLYGYETQDDG